MGTPKTSSVPQELRRPAIAEKVRLLNFGSAARKKLNLKELPGILQEMKMILFPLVPWLDKPVFSDGGILGNYHPPAAFHKKRAMLIFNGSNYGGFLDIMLERSDAWFVRIHPSDRHGDSSYCEADSVELARLIIQRKEALLKLSLGNTNAAEHFTDKVDFLEEIALYNGILQMLSGCFETVAQSLNEREERIRIMRERLALLNDFAESLDPLLAEARTMSLPEYSIFDHHSRGTSRYTGDYFCEDDLKPFWEHIKKVSLSWSGSYRMMCCASNVRSLSEFLRRVAYHVNEVVRAKSEGRTDAASLTGFTGAGRLPFSSNELGILRKLVGSIAQ